MARVMWRGSASVSSRRASENIRIGATLKTEKSTPLGNESPGPKLKVGHTSTVDKIYQEQQASDARRNLSGSIINQNWSSTNEDKNGASGKSSKEEDPKSEGKPGSEEPPSIFLTAALDETVRVWHIDKPKTPLVVLTVPKVNSLEHRLLYSGLRTIIAMDSNSNITLFRQGLRLKF